MKTETIKKSVDQMSTEELEAYLQERQAGEAQERKEKRQQYEKLREDVVTDLVGKASNFSNLLKNFKTQVWGDLETMYKLLQEHSSRHADGKGSFSMETLDGLQQVSFKRQDNTKFDERATQAERHILDFLVSHFGDDQPTSKLIRKLLERKKGQLEKDEVLKLISMKDDFNDENWRKGIELLQESIVPGDTRYYAQFKVRATADAPWTAIVLDFASI